MKRSDLRFLFAGVIIGVVAFVAGAWLLSRRAPGQQEVYERARRLDGVISSVADLYVDSLTKDDLYQLAIYGLLRSIDDPYAGFLENDDFDRHSELTSGTYAGIGIRVESNDGWITVVAPLAGSPAAAAGIQAGDRIVRINGKPAQGWTPDQSVDALRGETGSPVELSIARPGVPELLPFRLERDEIQVNSVRHAQLFDGNVGYVRLEIVSARSEEEIIAAVDSLRAQGADKLVLDLRGNPGGLLTESIAITDLFVDDRDDVVETRTRVTSTARTYRARRAERWPDMPVAVLVNEYSASASEIIAGALQDHDRALIIGQPTFGKGLVQSVFPLSGDRALKITTGKWYTPLGRSIQRDGDVPDSLATEFTTGAGRRLDGGGGVRPDIIFEHPDNAARQELDRVLGSDVQPFRAAMTSLALERAGTGEPADPEPGFPPLSLRTSLSERSVTFTDAEWQAVGNLVAREFSYLQARYREGEAGEFARRLADDDLFQLAVDRLRASRNTTELLGISEN